MKLENIFFSCVFVSCFNGENASVKSVYFRSFFFCHTVQLVNAFITFQGNYIIFIRTSSSMVYIITCDRHRLIHIMHIYTHTLPMIGIDSNTGDIVDTR